MFTIRHDSTRIERLVTANDDPSYRMSICSVLHITWVVMIICCNESFDSSRFVSIRQHFQTPIADTCVSCKLTSGMRFHVIRDGFSDFRYHITTEPRIDLRFDDSSTAFDDSQRFGCIGQPSPLDGVF